MQTEESIYICEDIWEDIKLRELYEVIMYTVLRLIQMQPADGKQNRWADSYICFSNILSDRLKIHLNSLPRTRLMICVPIEISLEDIDACRW